MATIQDKVRSIIASKLSIEESEITPEKSLVNDLGADSLDVVELSMDLGALHGRHLGDEESAGLGHTPFREGREHRGVAAFLAQGVGRIGEGDVEAGAGV